MNLIRHIKAMAANAYDRAVPVKPLNRSADEQSRLDRASRQMHLYFCRSCPTSIAVKRHCEKLGLKVVEKDVLRVNAYRNELLRGGGVSRVPCLHIQDKEQGSWLYSRENIVAYLNQHF